MEKEVSLVWVFAEDLWWRRSMRSLFPTSMPKLVCRATWKRGGAGAGHRRGAPETMKGGGPAAEQGDPLGRGKGGAGK